MHGYQSGRDAMKFAGRESFDLFILDWQVPDVSGADVLMWLRTNVSRQVPVLFVTVRDSEQPGHAAGVGGGGSTWYQVQDAL